MEVGLVSSDNVTGVLSFGGGVHFSASIYAKYSMKFN